jgi:hypothetical protein
VSINSFRASHCLPRLAGTIARRLGSFVSSSRQRTGRDTDVTFKVLHVPPDRVGLDDLSGERGI